MSPEAEDRTHFFARDNREEPPEEVSDKSSGKRFLYDIANGSYFNPFCLRS